MEKEDIDKMERRGILTPEERAVILSGLRNGFMVTIEKCDTALTSRREVNEVIRITLEKTKI